jgi:uncharacterized membrane protein YraQ (UPF0718 family)
VTISRENRLLLIFAGIFLLVYLLPFSSLRVSGAIQESFLFLSEYARAHVLLCLIPAFFIAGAITVFVRQDAVIRYLGPRSNKFLAYSVASVSGTILAVCSCTILPLFKGIYRKGAGLGPAVSFLYSGPAINVLAIILTARVLGLKMGVARTIGAVGFAFLVGVLMQVLFRKEDAARLTDESMFRGSPAKPVRPVWQDALQITFMIAILVFLNWSPSRGTMAVWDVIFRFKWVISAMFGILLLMGLARWFRRQELREWMVATRDFGLQILPLLFAGILVSGFLLGRPGHEGLIPSQWISGLVGGNSLSANFFSALAGSLMYFATLTEVPILQGLIGAGMGQGPALALLLAGPSLSLPSLLVIGAELGWRKTLAYAGLVVGLSTFAGMIFGTLVR